jgi:uncharacterized membrane protein
MIDLVLSPQRTVQREKSKQEKDVVGDRPYISLFKTISWRIVGTIDTITISYIITGHIGNALSIGGFEVFSKMILYYLHERAWNRARLK